MIGVLGVRKAAIVHLVQRYESLLVLTVLVLSGAALSWFAFTPFYESWQFFNNINLPMLSVIIVLLLADALAGRPLAVKAGALIVLALLATLNYGQLAARIDPKDINHQYSETFLQNLHQQSPRLSKIGGYVLANSEYKDAFSYNSTVFMPGVYMGNIRNDVNLVSLSQLNQDPDSSAVRFPEKSAAIREWIISAPICRFYSQARRRTPALSRPEALRQFVAKTHINFVCVSARAELPAALQPLVRSRLVDATTGEKVYMLQ